MGEVFRARDTRLGRDVAIKVLPAMFSADPDRRSRFEREARVLATLNHPHIGAIYGLDYLDGVPALILEFVDGETLAEHLMSHAQAPGCGLPVARALTVANQIAEALDAAHDRGIVHRDLKPSNVVLTGDGSVKVLDFGLAKAMSDDEAAPGPGTTRTGVVMGTPAYMSPEQAKGSKVDKRADIWALGCVLFEMLAGRRAFAGDTAAETLAAVLHNEPTWTALPTDTPAVARMVLTRCLEKDLKQRVRDIGDVRLALAGAFAPDTSAAVPRSADAAALPLWRRAVPVLAALAAGAVVTVIATSFQGQPPAPQVTRLSLEGTGTTALNVSGVDRELTITPDGSRVIYVGDGEIDGAIRGAAWLPDNTIVFATNRTAGLQRVSADGGMPTPLTKPDDARNEFAHLWPHLLPDGRALLYTALARTGGLAAAKVRLLDLQTNTSSDLLAGASNALYVTSGYLAYIAGATLWAVPFDLNRRATFGTAVPLLKQVVTTSNGAGLFAASTNGTLVYAHASDFDPLARSLNWIDRKGRVERIPAPPRSYAQPQLSHDRTRVVATNVQDPEVNLWVWDLTQRILTRITTDAALDIQPTWTPDDRWIVFGSNRGGGRQSLWRQASDGTGNPERLTQAAFLHGNPAVTPDGQHVLFSELTADGGGDTMRLTLATAQVMPVLRDRFQEIHAEVSPDGRWLAYDSNRSGRLETYVQPYPITGSARWQVSTGGGQSPAWSRDGRELFYATPDNALWSVPVPPPGSTWRAVRSVKVLEPGQSRLSIGTARNYDPAPDGRFLVIGPPANAPKPPLLVVVQHWDQELRSRVPAK